ncbi:MAG: ABC transporter ATP-binding protein [Anaerolineales bacterium]|nr:ABC transporter ATP-binding protein [Anaerolineales bacterium]
MSDTLLQTVELEKVFPVRAGFFGQHRLRLVAVDHVSLTIRKGETLGLVGESGCGKTTLGLTIMRLYEPTSGEVIFEGQPLTKLDAAGLQQSRRQMQMIFQDPLASLDPRMVVEEIIREPLDIHGEGSPKDRVEVVSRLLLTTGMPVDAAMRFPTEFSGGQQQRIGIARALALRPKLLVCDEPVSALDVSVQAQILNLLRDLQQKFELTYIFISHNIAVTAFMSRRIGVMYLGKLVEIGPSQEIVNRPLHPYTMALIGAVPDPEPNQRRERRKLTGDVPSPINRPTGCPFHPRCPWVQERCKIELPQLRELAPDHLAACHFAEPGKTL